MIYDISKLLSEWPFQSGQVLARVIEGQDGEPRIQVRLDLGLIQMLLDGRPDGQRPFDLASLLDHFEQRLEEVRGGRQDKREQSDPDAPSIEDAGEFSLSPEECRQLREEMAQYNQRSLALLACEDFERAARDAARNLRVIDFCREHAATEEDQTILEQYRPYVVMMKGRALASMALADNEPKAALLVLDEGLDLLKHIYSEAGRPQAYEQSPEAEMLRQIREQLVPKLPLSQKAELKKRLAEAVEAENYELAAILRDELKQLKD